MKRVTLGAKSNILNQLNEGKRAIDLCEDNNIDPSQISKWTEKENEIVEFIKGNKKMESRVRLPNNDLFTQLDKRLKAYVTICIDKGFPFNANVVRAKARLEAEKLGITGFVASRSWFTKFANRNGLTYAKISGESKSVDQSVVSWFLSTLPKKLSNYTLDEIYNADETGLQYKGLNDYSYSFNSSDRHGTKTRKDHISILLCSSASGIKKKPLVIGHAAKPRCFREINFDYASLGIDYAYSKKAYMNSTIWQKWLSDWDHELINENKKILLFVDNCRCHCKLPELVNIKVEFLPPNCTSEVQPLDAGIIASFKHHYRENVSMLLSQLITTDTTVDELVSSISLLHAFRWISDSWEKVTQQTLTNCYNKCGFIKD